MNIVNNTARKTLQLGHSLGVKAYTYHVWSPGLNPWHEKRKERMKDKKKRGGKGLLKHSMKYYPVQIPYYSPIPKAQYTW